MPDSSKPAAVHLTSLSLTDAAKVITQAGGIRLTAADLQADIDAGAPINPDGTISILAYASWLVKEAADVD